MREGIYESLLTDALAQSIEESAPLEPQFEEVDPADQPAVLARYVAGAVLEALESTRDPEARLEIVEAILKSVDGRSEVN